MNAGHVRCCHQYRKMALAGLSVRHCPGINRLPSFSEISCFLSSSSQLQSPLASATPGSVPNKHILNSRLPADLLHAPKHVNTDGNNTISACTFWQLHGRLDILAVWQSPVFPLHYSSTLLLFHDNPRFCTHYGVPPYRCLHKYAVWRRPGADLAVV